MVGSHYPIDGWLSKLPLTVTRMHIVIMTSSNAPLRVVHHSFTGMRSAYAPPLSRGSDSIGWNPNLPSSMGITAQSTTLSLSKKAVQWHEGLSLVGEEHKENDIDTAIDHRTA